MSAIRARFKEAGDTYILLVTVLALNAPLILASILSILAGQSLSPGAWLYAVMVAVGYYCLPLLVVVSAVFVLTFAFRRVALTLGITIVASFVAFLLLDAVAYRVVKFHIDPFWIEFAIKDHSGLGLPSSTWFAALAIVLGVVAAQVGFVALAKRFRMRRTVAAFPVVAVLFFAFSQIVHVVAYEWNNQRVTSLTPHFPLYVPITSHKNASTYKEMLPWADAEAAVPSEEIDSSVLRYPMAEIEFGAEESSTTPNIVLILLESWRYDSMNEAVSPNIYSLGQRSTVFLDHMSSGNQTTCGVFGLFYGLHPTYWTAVKANSAEIHNPVLIDALEERGYDFGIFAKSSFKRHKIEDTVFNGIRVRESFEGRSKVEQDADLTRQMIRYIEEQVEQGRPYFAFAFYKSTHAPYEYPPEHDVFNGGKKTRMGFTNGHTDPGPRMQRYRNAVHYIDSLVDQVVVRLQELGQMDNTVVIVTSDHGESFNDNGSNYWGHGSNYTQYQTRVPLVFYAPGREPRRVERRTSHIDIAPTLLREYLACKNDVADYSNGRVLFDDVPGARPLAVGSYVNHSFVFGDDVFEIRPMRTKKYKLQDVAAEAGWPESEQLRRLTDEVRRFSGP